MMKPRSIPEETDLIKPPPCQRYLFQFDWISREDALKNTRLNRLKINVVVATKKRDVHWQKYTFRPHDHAEVKKNGSQTKTKWTDLKKNTVQQKQHGVI